MQTSGPADPDAPSPRGGSAPRAEPPTVDEVLEALHSVDDPEVGMNIVDLGLVYRVETTPERILVEFTLTSPACPLGDYISDGIRRAIASIAPGDIAVQLEQVFEPPWTPERMSETAKQILGWRG